MTRILPDQNIPAIQPPKMHEANPGENAPVQPKPLADKTDAGLAASNVVVLSLDAACRYSPELGRYLQIPLFVARCLHFASAIRSIPWKSTTQLEKVSLLNPAIWLASWFSPEINTLRSAALTLGVARRSLPKLIQSVKEVTKRPFAAIGSAFVHALNIVTSAYFTYRAWEEISIQDQKWEEKFKRQEEENEDWWEKFYEQNAGQRNQDFTCSGSSKPAAYFAKMDPFSRLTSPELDPKCPPDAAKALGVTIDSTCENAPPNKIKEACAEVCAAINAARRKLSRTVHPDKHPQNPQKATAATQNLNNFVDTLTARYECRA